MSSDTSDFMRDYDRLWRRLRGAGGAARAGIIREMAVLAGRAEQHYRQQAASAYRRAMWHRRRVIHERGEVAGVWDGTDALAWQAQVDRQQRGGVA